MVQISFNTDNLEEEIKQELRPLFTRISADLSNYIGDEVPVGATGNLRNSVQILGYNSKEGRSVVAVRADYANTVRLGQDPGTTPNFESLRKWVDRVIGKENFLDWQGEDWEVNTLDEATYLVSRSIQQSGTDPNPYIERSLKRLRQKYS